MKRGLRKFISGYFYRLQLSLGLLYNIANEFEG